MFKWVCDLNDSQSVHVWLCGCVVVYLCVCMCVFGETEAHDGARRGGACSSGRDVPAWFKVCSVYVYVCVCVCMCVC